MGAFDFPIFPGLDEHENRSVIVAEHRPEDKTYAGYYDADKVNDTPPIKCESIPIEKPVVASNFWYWFWMAILWGFRGFFVYIIVWAIWRAFVQ